MNGKDILHDEGLDASLCTATCVLPTVIRHSSGLHTVGRECVVRVSGGPELYLENDLLGVVHVVGLV